ncbi:MAG: C4-dicarboxylate ABC transporter substrate-binding protein, partial [Burkholderiales bacterium]
MKFRTIIAAPMFATVALFAASSASATTFKVAVGDAQGSTQWELGTFFKKAFEEKTGGKHKVDLFPNGQLGSEEN